MRPDQSGALVECNSDPAQPTIEFSGIAVPVSCSNIYGIPLDQTLVATDDQGAFQATFVVRTGVLGPPTSGTDSAGNAASSDASAYPCPPTAAQRAAGDVCWVAFGDLGGDVAHQDISFALPLLAFHPSAVIEDGGYEVAGTVVDFIGSGFAPDSPATVTECNLTPGEPANIDGAGPVVGCAPPPPTPGPPPVLMTDASGSLDTTFTLQEGNLGGTPQSAAYPCPPTPANVAAGGSCDLVAEDGGGNTVDAYLGLTGPVPTPAISVTPADSLLAGQQVTVTGAGFGPEEPVTVLECNESPGEPTVEVDGMALPVGCGTPWDFAPLPFFGGFGFTDADGTFSSTLPVETGEVGPPDGVLPVPGEADSAGNAAGVDAANYPCPPTPAEVAEGATCLLSAVDSGNDRASEPITFGPPETFSPTVAVLPLSGTLDLAAIPEDTDVVVSGAGFEPGAEAVVFECGFEAGAPLGGDGLPEDCAQLGQIEPLLTASGGALSTTVYIEAFYPTGGYPGAAACAAGSQVGSCDIVVIDSAGDQARVPIGVAPAD